MGIILDNGETSNSIEDVLLKWKTDFEKLYNSSNPSSAPNNQEDSNVIGNTDCENDKCRNFNTRRATSSSIYAQK